MKAAVVMFPRTLALELARRSIRVNVMTPSPAAETRSHDRVDPAEGQRVISTKSQPCESLSLGVICATMSRGASRRISHYIPLISAFTPALKGLTVTLIIPEGEAPTAEMNLTVPRSSSHLSAARSSIRYLDVELQEIDAGAWMIPAVGASADDANPGKKPFLNAKLPGPMKLAECPS